MLTAMEGAIITWHDARNGNHDPFAQHVLASGTVDAAWPVNGRALSLSSGEQTDASIVGDGGGGAIVAWEEDSFVFVNHIQASGLLDPLFPINGRIVRPILTFQHNPVLAASRAGDAIVAWADAVNQDFDIYAMIVETEVTVDVDPGKPVPGITFAPPSPNPARGAVTLRFALPRAASVSLAIFDVSGRRVRVLTSGAQPDGPHAVAWDLRDESGSAAGAGVYFARLDVEGQVLTRKFAKLK